jgi:hypothetical protein
VFLVNDERAQALSASTLSSLWVPTMSTVPSAMPLMAAVIFAG